MKGGGEESEPPVGGGTARNGKVKKGGIGLSNLGITPDPCTGTFFGVKSPEGIGEKRSRGKWGG